MAETALSGRPTATRPTLVTATALAAHLCCTRQYIARLTSDGVIGKSGAGYDQDQCRARYLTHLRSENRKSPRLIADAAYAKQKARWLELKIAQQEKTTMRVDDHNDIVESCAGIVLTKLSGWPPRIAGNDLVLRRKAEALLFELRVEIARACEAEADRRGEPK